MDSNMSDDMKTIEQTGCASQTFGGVSRAFTDQTGKRKKAFIGFVTAGDPSAEATVDFVLEMERAGMDLIEIGIPFSDPTAEGPVIQGANIRSLSAGMTVDGVFDIVRQIRKKSSIPLVFLSYCNPVFHYTYGPFFARCAECGVDGIIFPDIPYEERGEVLPYAEKHGIDLISLVAPTSSDRIQMIAREAQGFVYTVSSMGVTGVRDRIETDISSIVRAVRSVTDVPVAVGFGVSTPEQAARISQVADGVIVGSAIVKIIEAHGEKAAMVLGKYVKKMKEAINHA